MLPDEFKQMHHKKFVEGFNCLNQEAHIKVLLVPASVALLSSDSLVSRSLEVSQWFLNVNDLPGAL